MMAFSSPGESCGLSCAGGCGELLAEREDFLLRQRAARKFAVERGTGDEFHHDEVAPRLGDEVVDSGNVRMIQPRERQRFLLETLADTLVVEHAGGEHLDG